MIDKKTRKNWERIGLSSFVCETYFIELFNTCNELEAENAKLKEAVRVLGDCVGHSIRCYAGVNKMECVCKAKEALEKTKGLG